MIRTIKARLATLRRKLPLKDTRLKKAKPRRFMAITFGYSQGGGASAPGGAKSYLVNGNMRDGFAMLAYPTEYKNSGVMTFIIDDHGMVYQKDLGADTSTAALAITVFDPDTSWEKAESE